MALRLKGQTTGYVELAAPASAADNTLTLPNGNGTNGQFVTTNGSGGLSFTTISALPLAGGTLTGGLTGTTGTFTGNVTAASSGAFSGSAGILLRSDTNQIFINGTADSASALDIKGNAIIKGDGSATFAGTISDSIGPLRRLGVNAQGGAYAFVVGDAGKIIRSAGSGSALTLNQNIFTAGDMISVFNVGSGTNTVVQGTGVTLYNTADAATGTRTIAAKGMVTIVCTASNEFAISGSQLT